MQVVQRDQAQTKNFFRFDEVTDIAPREFLTCRTSTIFFDGALVQREPGILKIDRACGGVPSPMAYRGLSLGKNGSVVSTARIISSSGSPTLTPPMAYPSKLRLTIACALSRRRSSNVAPWTMPKSC